MTHRGPARDAVLGIRPDGQRAMVQSQTNDSILRALGLSNPHIEAISRSAQTRGRDSLVQFAAEMGVACLDTLATWPATWPR